ncbi:MAG: V-type ATP synthase subunit E [Actinomycetota bacterium]|nr:V-type ATP synthase subunit E [Actinomycetota bacterium]
MALEDIINRIINDAKEVADDIRAEAKAEAERIRAAAKAEAEAKKSAMIVGAKAEAERESKRLLSLARLEAKNAVLAKKRSMIDSVFTGALSKIQSLSKGEYEDLIKKMVLGVSLGGDEELILSSPDREKLGEGFIKDINTALKGQGKKAELKLSKESRETRGGFILKSGKIETNSTFPVIVEMLRESLEPKIIGILFGHHDSAPLSPHYGKRAEDSQI